MTSKKNKFLYDEISFDSNEEVQMYKWLEDCTELGLVLHFEYQPQPFLLSEKVLINNKSALQKHIYTPDFKVQFSQNPIVKQLFPFTQNQVFIDVKGGFSIYNNHSQFSVNRKWVYQKYGVYVYKVEVQKLFKKSFVPESCLYTAKLHKLRKKYENYSLIEEFKRKINL